MSKSGDGSTDGSTDGRADNDAGTGGAVPKLTMGQRVLASLPNLQKQAPAPADNAQSTTQGSTKSTSQGPTKSITKGPASVVTPDEVLAPGAATAAPRRSLLDSFFKPAARSGATRAGRGAPSGMTAEELTYVIKRIDDREQFLAYATAALGLIVPARMENAEAVYNAERAVLEGFRVVPLFHLPDVYGAGPRVRGAAGISPLGQWKFGNVWLEGDRP